MSGAKAEGFLRLRLDLGYDGTAYRGWARQPNQESIQESVEVALQTVLRTPTAPQLTVAGRTDAGVHATGQVAHVDLAAEFSQSQLDTLTRRINGILRHDIRIHRIAPAPEGFDARFSALWRRYRYRIADSPHTTDPLRRHDTLSWDRHLDVDRLNEASADLRGHHDFASFCRRREGATTIRLLQRLDWIRDEEGVIVATFQADAFCHSMVRALVGSLLPVGDGRRAPTWPRELLAAARRDSAVEVARPHGLTLVEVAYPDDAELARRAAATRRQRLHPEMADAATADEAD